jgi:hypothetical protein
LTDHRLETIDVCLSFGLFSSQVLHQFLMDLPCLVLLLHLTCVLFQDDLFLFLDVGQFFLQFVPSEVVNNPIRFESFHHADQNLPVRISFLQMQFHFCKIFLKLSHPLSPILLLILKTTSVRVQFVPFFFHVVDWLLQGLPILVHVVVFLTNNHQIVVGWDLLDVVHLLWLFSQLSKVSTSSEGEVSIPEWERRYLMHLFTALRAGNLKASV